MAALALLAGCGDDDAEPAGADCATKELYGHTVEIRVVGKPVSCDEVRRVVAGPCRDGKKWSCFSFWPPDPVLVWFLERERFNPGPDDFSTAIEGRRWPCSEARVTRASWARAKRNFDDSEAFPTEQQVLADDIIRCKLLRGMKRRAVVRLLGPHEGIEGDDYISYTVGPERDSFFQVDSEALSIEFDRRGTFKQAELVQQ